MRRFKSHLLPFVSDAVAFALLSISVATIAAMAMSNGSAQQATVYESLPYGIVGL